MVSTVGVDSAKPTENARSAIDGRSSCNARTFCSVSSRALSLFMDLRNFDEFKKAKIISKKRGEIWFPTQANTCKRSHKRFDYFDVNLFLCSRIKLSAVQLRRRPVK